MSTIRVVIFLVGLALMAVSLFVPFARVPEGGWFSWNWLFSFGLLLAVGAHGWPDNLT
jgi:hypothetical protein